ncbi:MAG: hypothetical protein SWK76_06045 [Actinomycetota bacterium]|nr:hypothetical protein [Actinomycetota bacterium]
MIISKEGRNVFKRFCLIALGIPTTLLVFVLALYFFPLAIEKAQVSTMVLNVAAACLGLIGLGIWLFFGQYLYGRLWKLYPDVTTREKAVSYAMGVFGFLGVGTSMVSVLGLFYYLFSGDVTRGVVLIGVSVILALVESARFPGRFDRVERIIAELE